MFFSVARETAMKKNIKMQTNDLCFFYGEKVVLCDLNSSFAANSLTAVVGPSGSGKSTFLSALNRLWEEIPGARVTGTVELNLKGKFVDIRDPCLAVQKLRSLVGMVFQTPNPLPMSIFKNIAFPLKLHGLADKQTLAGRVENALKTVWLWDEVKDRLSESALKLSGGQRQRLCMARALMLEPEVLLMDEPTSSLDPKATAVIEELLLRLKERCTLVVVSHCRNQVERIADSVVEFG